MLDGEAVFLPSEIPRQGMLALWGTGTGTSKIELVFPGGTYGVRKRLVSATLLPLSEALPQLLAINPSTAGPGLPEVRRSVSVWAAAATAGVGLVARGRLLPTVGPDGVDTWQAGPLDPADLAWLRELEDSFPPAAHALGVPGSRPMRIRSPESLVRALWDAIADTLVRTAAASRTVCSPAFAAPEPTAVPDLAEWLADTTDGLSAGARLGLRVEPVPAATEPDQWTDDEEDEDTEEDTQKAAVRAEEERAHDENQQPAADDVAPPAFRLVLQLRSTADPSLIVDAANLWEQPERVITRFGAQAETDLLLALRRGAGVWPPLAPVLEQASPSALALDDDGIASLLGPTAEELAGAGIEVLWPSSLVGDGLKLQAVIMPALSG